MQNKYKLAGGTKRLATASVECYRRYKREINEQIGDIVGVGSALGRYELTAGGDRVYTSGGKGGTSSPTENQAMQLEKLESDYKFKTVKAVESSFSEILQGYPPELAEKIKNALIESCTRGQKERFRFEYSGIDGMSQATFYRVRNKLLFTVAEKLGYL